MDNYPLLTDETNQALASVVRDIVSAREGDITEFNAVAAQCGYENGFKRVTKSISSSYAVGSEDYYIDATGTITLTLDADPFDGQTHVITKADSGTTTTIDGNGNNINGAATATIGTQYAWRKVVFMGGAGEWRLMS